MCDLHIQSWAITATSVVPVGISVRFCC